MHKFVTVLSGAQNDLYTSNYASCTIYHLIRKFCWQLLRLLNCQKILLVTFPCYCMPNYKLVYNYAITRNSTGSLILPRVLEDTLHFKLIITMQVSTGYPSCRHTEEIVVSCVS